ncbi:LacI family DNA-binding transcriptional regulator [Dactylosporangium sp. AC04546]|uniref:LacI family DNA-binding transcriptional regulator n=1 Tax=Dactylosporangium sp. AC04546 TaxID=2862460 RepID=UPI001EDE9377|nr:LacI family DNA-binding transcriptional regulator [Dactylosporangium sp. AC04546]WVK87769.1 LacI family DNA-binding transcriptional regulator [Dactylosporangium sp. AC04546]
MATTIGDVARQAGVSPSTVSYVLSGKRTISEETRQRVLAAIEVLGYHPHAGARALASNRSNVVALIMPLYTGLYVPVLMQFVISVVTAARRFDHDVLLLTQDEGEKGLERVAASSLADALIVMDVELHDRRLPRLRTLGRPSVLIGFPADASGLTCIDLDFAAAGAACVDHLADLGHDCVALVGSPPEVYERELGFASRTAAGFTEALLRRGLRGATVPCEPTPVAALETVRGLLAKHPDLTGVVVHNEETVAPLLEAFAAVGKRVPDDVSVVAICPDDVAERVKPRVTSVSIPAEELGRRAVELVVAKLDGTMVPEATLLAPTLTERDSAAGARPTTGSRRRR